MRVDVDDWPQLIARYRLTPCEGRALRDIYDGGKFAAIGRKYGGTAHAIDKHWRAIQQKMAPTSGGIKGRVLVTRAIADFLADLRLNAITAPLHTTIASLQQQVRELQEQVEALRQEKEQCHPPVTGDLSPDLNESTLPTQAKGTKRKRSPKGAQP